MKLPCIRGDVWNSLVPSRNATLRRVVEKGKVFVWGLTCYLPLMWIGDWCLWHFLSNYGKEGGWESHAWKSCGRELTFRYAEVPLLSHVEQLWNWSAQICLWLTFSIWCSFPHSLLLPWSLLLLFLFSIYCPKSNSPVVSSCRFLSEIVQLSSSLFPHLPQCCGYCSQDWTMCQVLPEQSLFCLFVNWESDFCPLRQLTYARKHFCRAGLLPSFTLLTSPKLCQPCLVSQQ